MTNEEKAVGMSLQVRDLCVEKGVTRDNAETVSLLVQQATLQIAKWKEQQMIKKACEWLESNLYYYDENYRGIDSGNSLVEDFKQAMEE